MSNIRVTAQQRAQVIARANGRCEYCQAPTSFSATPYAIEHIIPRAKGGATTVDNLALSCSGCNGYKYTRTEWEDPVTKNRVQLFHPRQDNWHKHFMWNENSFRIVGLTSVGRSTIAALKLNRIELVNLRYALHAIGKHPPKID